MPILFECKSCKKELRAMEYLAGRTLRCPQCMTEFAVPAIGEGDPPARFIHKEFTWMKTKLAPGQAAPAAAPAAPMAEPAAAPAAEPALAPAAATAEPAGGGGVGLGGVALAAGIGAVAGAGIAMAAMSGSGAAAEAAPPAELPPPEAGGPSGSLSDDPTAPPVDSGVLLSSNSVLGEALPAEGAVMAPAEGEMLMEPTPETLGEAPAEGFGEAPAEGFGEAPAEGFGAAPAEGFGAAPAEGFGEAPAEGFGEAPAEGFGEAPAEGFGEAPLDAPPLEEPAAMDGFGDQAPLEAPAEPPPLDVSLLDEPIPADGLPEISTEAPIPLEGGEMVGGDMAAAGEPQPFQQYEFTEDIPAVDPNAAPPPGQEDVLEDIPVEEGDGASSIF